VSTPEDFLKRSDLLRQMTTEMAPVYELVATLRRGFMEEGGLGSEAADDLIATMVKMYVFKVLPIPDAA
jgi:hypothetical protein